MFISLSGVFHICGPQKDCIQSCCSEGSPENIRGSPKEEAGKRRNRGKWWEKRVESFRTKASIA